jgi:TIR domain
MKKYDIFISYRREGGFETAQLLYNRLRAAGYRVFFDIETMRSGPFNRQLYDVIDRSIDVIVILSPDVFAPRSEANEDWLRMEIAHTLNKQKNIIPLMIRGFAFTDIPPLSSDIEPLRMQHGLEASPEHFDAVIEKLRKTLLLSRPVFFRPSLIPWVIGVLLLALSSIFIWQGKQVFTPDLLVFPASTLEKSLVNEALSYAGIFLQYSDLQHEGFRKFLAECSYAIEDGITAEEMENLKRYGAYYRLQMRSHESGLQPIDDLIAALRQTPLAVEDLRAMHGILDLQAADMERSIDGILQVMDPHLLFPDVVLRKFIKLYTQWNVQSARMHWYAFCEFLLPIDAAALDSFKQNTLPNLTYMYSEFKTLEQDPAICKAQQDAAFNQLQKILTDIAAEVGEVSKVNFVLEKRVDALVAKAAEQFPAHLFATQQKALEKKKEELENSNLAMQDLYEQVRQKGMVQESDAPGVIWNKMLLLLRVGLKEQALINLRAFEKKQMLIGEDVTGYTKAASVYIQQQVPALSQAGSIFSYQGGALVFGFANDAAHSSLQSGDIIISVDGKPVENAQQFVTLKKARAGKDFFLQVLRLNASEALDPLILKVRAADPPIGVSSLKVEE